jgi:hypothetical protein
MNITEEKAKSAIEEHVSKLRHDPDRKSEESLRNSPAGTMQFPIFSKRHCICISWTCTVCQSTRIQPGLTTITGAHAEG